MSKIIHICGLKGSGKTTVGKLLKKNLPNAKIIHYADLLKDIMSGAFGLRAGLIDTLKNTATVTISSGDFKKTLTMREVLQNFGTEGIRHNVSPDFWRDQAKLKIKKAIDNGADYILIPDTRFENEFLPDSISIQVIRDSQEVVVDNHASENSLTNKNFDFVIDNNGGMHDLRLNLQEVIDAI